jgi:hypothetical protein
MSKPKRIQTLVNLAAQPFRLAAPVHDISHERQTCPAPAGGERGKKVADGFKRGRANISILRAERRTQIHCASPGLDARRKDEVTVFRAVCGSTQ